MLQGIEQAKETGMITSGSEEGTVISNRYACFVSPHLRSRCESGKVKRDRRNRDRGGFARPRQVESLEWNRTLNLEKPYPRLQLYPTVLFSGRVGAYLFTMGDHVLTDFCPDLVQVEQEVFSFSAFEIALWASTRASRSCSFVENINRHLSPLRRWICQFVLDTVQLIITGNHEAVDVLRRLRWSN